MLLASMLVICKHRVMATLYIRDVPEDVAQTLKDRAAERGESLSVFATRELTRIARHPTNAEIIARLERMERASPPPTIEQIVEAVHEGRRDRA